MILQKSSKVPNSPDAETRMSNRQGTLDDEAGERRNTSAEIREPIRPHTDPWFEGMASDPSRVVRTCLRYRALCGVYPMEMAVSTSMRFELATEKLEKHPRGTPAGTFLTWAVTRRTIGGVAPSPGGQCHSSTRIGSWRQGDFCAGNLNSRSRCRGSRGVQLRKIGLTRPTKLCPES
jgi:hypothetical protein